MVTEAIKEQFFLSFPGPDICFPPADTQACVLGETVA